MRISRLAGPQTTLSVPSCPKILNLVCVVGRQEGEWLRLHEEPQFLEGWKVAVKVARDWRQSGTSLTVAFATSDLTARGVDSDAYEDCSALAVSKRISVSKADRHRDAQIHFAHC